MKTNFTKKTNSIAKLCSAAIVRFLCKIGFLFFSIPDFDYTIIDNSSI